MRSEAEKTECRIRRLFHKGCVEYGMIEEGDKILVALSGGKDSLELLRLLAQQSRLHKPAISVEAAHVVMDNIPYDTDRSYLVRFCEEQGVRLHILHASFDESTDRRRTKCFLCSWNRRKALFTFAAEGGFGKVALGHHQDDIIVTLLMNQTFEGSIQTMPPKLRMEHYPITVIRPMCLVPEYLIARVAELLGFEKMKTPCPFETATHRATMTQLFRQLETINPEARHSLWSAMKNVHRELLP
ncbi:MAG: ATP-binding protein [Prevotellaceae bacterium]|nr:tRNA 2-thiocytidine(32) synthetase TtcA [Prevotella sp.]MDD7248030.1 ATP-binding protein [Prevotellaceae bacterium]MDY2750043.1 ATP-binding protein [Prevotella sp.]